MGLSNSSGKVTDVSPLPQKQRKGIYNFPQPAFIAQRKCILHFKLLVSESDNKLKNCSSKRLFCLSVHVASAGSVIKFEFRRSVGFHAC